MLLTLAIPAMASAWNVPKERVTYDIMYKWGLINKKAGIGGFGNPSRQCHIPV